MFKNRLPLLTAVLGFSLVVAPGALADDSMAERISTASTIMKRLAVSDTPPPQSIIDRAAGVALVKITRGGFVIGASHGTGVVLKNLGDGKWSPPIAFNTTGGSFGAQVGGSTIRYLFVLNNAAALDMFTSGEEVNFDAGASATAGPKHAQADKQDLPGESIYVYSTSDGAFAGATVGGSVIKVQDAINQAAYGADVTTAGILANKVQAPESAAALVALLNGQKSED